MGKRAKGAPDNSADVYMNRNRKKASKADVDKLKNWKGTAVDDEPDAVETKPAGGIDDSATDGAPDSEANSETSSEANTEADSATEVENDGAADSAAGGDNDDADMDDSDDDTVESKLDDSTEFDHSDDSASDSDADGDASSEANSETNDDSKDDFGSEFEEEVDATNDSDPFESDDSDDSDEAEKPDEKEKESPAENPDATEADPPDDTEEFDPNAEDLTGKLDVEQYSLPRFSCHRCRHLMPALPEFIYTKASVMVKESTGKSRPHKVDIKVPYGKKLNCFTDPKCPARVLEMVYCPITDEEIEAAVDDLFMNDDTLPLKVIYDKADKLGEAQAEQVKAKAKELMAQRNKEESN